MKIYSLREGKVFLLLLPRIDVTETKAYPQCISAPKNVYFMKNIDILIIFHMIPSEAMSFYYDCSYRAGIYFGKYFSF